MLSKKLLSCFISISSYFVLGTVAREVIIDGELVKNNFVKFPYQVSMAVQLNSTASFFCGGGIIDDSFILTAAHCIIGIDLRASLFIIAGTANRKNDRPPAEKVAVKKIFWPKRYELKTISWGDIAVLMLQHSLRLPLQRNWKLHLPYNERETYKNVIAEIAGYGNNRIDADGVGTSDGKLRFAQAKVDPHCNNNIAVPERFFCAQVIPHGHSKPRAVALGDSGSPLVYNGIVIGILSAFTINSTETPSTPAIYSRVRYYLSLICNAMRNIVTDDMATIEFLHP